MLCLLLSKPLWACQLTVRVPLESAPPAFILENGQWHGLSPQMVELWLAKTGCQAHYRSLPFKRALNYLSAGKIDVMFHLSKNKAREQDYYFIGPMAYEELIMFTLNNTEVNIDSLADVATIKEPIATLRGIFYGKEFNDLVNNDVAFKKRVIAVDHVNQLAAMLERKRIIGFLFNSFYGRTHEQVTRQLKGVDNRIILLSKSPVYFALSKKSISLMQYEQLKLAFEQVKTHPKVRKILEHSTYQ